MKLTTTGRLTAIILGAAMLAACNGNNPFKGDSNPVKEYPSATEGIPYDPDNKPVEEPAPDNTQNVCGLSMHVATVPAHDSLFMAFTEGEKGAYKVVVTTRTTKPYTITHTGPEGSTFVVAEKAAGKTTFDFVWTPEKTSGGSQLPKKLEVFLNYTNETMRLACGEASVPVTLVTNKTSLDPQVAFANLPETIAYQAESIGFQFQVDDPSSTQATPPAIKEIGFRNQGGTGRNTILNAKDAVKCDEPAQLVEGTKWVFNCHLNLADVSKIDPTSTKPVVASFFIQAQSKNNEKTSIRKQGSVTVTFAPKTGA